jgi:hypothetical protein
MNTPLRACAAIFDPEPNSEHAQQEAQLRRRQDRANPRHSPLPSVREINAALERKVRGAAILGVLNLEGGPRR